MPRSDANAGPLPEVPGYEVLRQIGQGGMGRVYLARQTALGRDVCVKLLGSPTGADAAEGVERFRREAKLLAMVAHPHVLTILDFGTLPNSDTPYLVTEYIENGDLRRLLRGGKPLSISKQRAILSQVGQALLHLHSKGILHRDLKPENILAPTDSLVKVADFGLAVLQSERGQLTQTNRGIGSLIYASPEQQNGGLVDARSDQYSFAAMAYEMLTGKRPVGNFKPPSAVDPTLDRRLDGVLMKALSREPEGRYNVLDDFLKDLDESLAADSSLFARPRLATGLVVLAVLVVLAAMWHFRGTGSGQAPTPESPTSGPAQPGVDTQGASTASPRPSPEFHRLTEIRAHEIWVSQGSPTGPEGEAVSMTNWLEAERQVREEVEQRAYELWKAQGSPTGAAGVAVRERNMRKAEAELLEKAQTADAP